MRVQGGWEGGSRVRGDVTNLRDNLRAMSAISLLLLLVMLLFTIMLISCIMLV